MITRRFFLAGAALVAAPSIVRAASLMAVKAPPVVAPEAGWNLDLEYVIFGTDEHGKAVSEIVRLTERPGGVLTGIVDRAMRVTHAEVRLIPAMQAKEIGLPYVHCQVTLPEGRSIMPSWPAPEAGCRGNQEPKMLRIVPGNSR